MSNKKLNLKNSRYRHNKKRNTAFIFEALVRHYTEATIAKHEGHCKALRAIFTENFAPNTLLKKELELYNTLHETRGLRRSMAERLVENVKAQHNKIDKEELYREHSRVINRINKYVSKDVYEIFVPKYKQMATSYHIMRDELSPTDRLVMEETVIQRITSKPSTILNEELVPLDDLEYRMFVKNYNEKYTHLHEEQRKLLSRYIASDADNGVTMKVYLNEEVSRLRKIVSDSLLMEEINGDTGMVKSTQTVIDMLEEIKQRPVDEGVIESVLKIQELARELTCPKE